MRMKLLAVWVVTVLVILPSCTRNREIGQVDKDSASIPVSRLSGSEISQKPSGVSLKFEAIVVNRPSQKCIELFTPDEFEKYEGDPNGRVSSALGFELAILETLPEKSKATVTGRYVFVKDLHEGPCGIVTGHLFEISDIEYF